MAYDELLTERMRAAIGPLDGLSEKRMMGGICFFLHGNMIGGADRTKQGVSRFMFRCGVDNKEAASLPSGEPMVMGERLMRGFYFVDAASCDSNLLAQWTHVALANARSLPPK